MCIGFLLAFSLLSISARKNLTGTSKSSKWGQRIYCTCQNRITFFLWTFIYSIYIASSSQTIQGNTSKATFLGVYVLPFVNSRLHAVTFHTLRDLLLNNTLDWYNDLKTPRGVFYYLPFTLLCTKLQTYLRVIGCFSPPKTRRRMLYMSCVANSLTESLHRVTRPDTHLIAGGNRLHL